MGVQARSWQPRLLLVQRFAKARGEGWVTHGCDHAVSLLPRILAPMHVPACQGLGNNVCFKASLLAMAGWGIIGSSIKCYQMIREAKAFS
eukprot:429271-Pelagomonas_calceolata.AAC.1